MLDLVRALYQNCTYRDVLALCCLHGMMDLYGEKRLVILVPNIRHLVFTVGFFLISSPRRDNILSQGENSALECVPRGSLIEHRYIERWYTVGTQYKISRTL